LTSQSTFDQAAASNVGNLASVLLKPRTAKAPRLSSRVKDTEAVVVMKEVKRVLMAVLMAMILSLNAFAPMSAFGQKNDNRPPKQPEKVKDPDKQPRGNNNQSNSNKHGRN